MIIFLPAMELGIFLSFLIVLVFVGAANSEGAQGVTWIQDGFNFIAKLPCIGCPFLYQDTSKGEKGPWTVKKDTNALVNTRFFSNPGQKTLFISNILLSF